MLFRQRKQNHCAKRDYREGVEKRREEREAEKAEKLAQKQARAAELASLVSKRPRKIAST